TVNDMSRLPRSLYRAGRFDRRLEINAPRGADALEIISHYLDGKSLADNIDRQYIARLMEGDSCAKLETLINEAGVYAGFDRADKISMEHFMRAYLRSTYGCDIDGDDNYCGSEGTKKEFADTIWHEAGHAVVSEVLYPGSVTLVSVACSGSSSKGGFTSSANINSIIPIDYARIRAISSLAGAAAIEQRFGVAGGGASRDYYQAFRTVRQMIEDDCVCGFGLREAPFGNSEKLNSRIEQATAVKIEEFYRKAKEILAKNREFLEKIVAALAEKKLLTAPEIQSIRNGCNIVRVGI
ncbi:MAG: hypothetical protein IKN56_06305, partial [Clostridia bacterium]|nr:hypothetical protein [Clostridia bacterium]